MQTNGPPRHWNTVWKGGKKTENDPKWVNTANSREEISFLWKLDFVRNYFMRPVLVLSKPDRTILHEYKGL